MGLPILKECKVNNQIKRGLVVEEELTSESIRSVIEKGRLLGEFIAYQRFSEKERNQFREIIRQFHDLYYRYPFQTWWSTTWRGVHVLKAPTDMWIYQELICRLKPSIIIETGTYRGGSALFLRDMMRLSGIKDGLIISIDCNDHEIDDRVQREFYSSSSGMIFVHGDSVSKYTYDEVQYLCIKHTQLIEEDKKNIMVILDSDHQKEHVLAELMLYAPLVTKGMPLIVEDGSNHDGVKSAIEEWYPNQCQFKRDVLCEKYMLTFNRDGFFEKVVD